MVCPNVVFKDHNGGEHFRLTLEYNYIVNRTDDVELAIKHKLDGIVISNHGGRQLDGVPATLDVLRECAPVARGKIPLAIDSGIRRGSDIFKALALGASHCFIGRAAIWGLAVSKSTLTMYFARDRLTYSSIMARKELSWGLRFSYKNCVLRWL